MKEKNIKQLFIKKIKIIKNFILIFISIITILLSNACTISFLDKNNESNEQNDIKNSNENNNENDSIYIAETTKEITLIEAKEYLKKNWDKFKIDGSTSMIVLHKSLNNLFGSENDEISHSKTVDAFEKFIKGENDILLGVSYSNELLNKAKENDTDVKNIEITREGFIFLINKNNIVKNLTVEQLKDIYSGKIKNWKDVGGDDSQIIAYQRNDDSGSQMRMNIFMGNTKLIDKTYVADGMGELVLSIAGSNSSYIETNNAIGYNMYTFTEKQYSNDYVDLLNINGIEPNDETIFNETYPLVIYNYIYYNNKNIKATEFANNLYVYLMSDEGQKLISNSGYVNLNKKLDRNKNIEIPYENEEYIDFYNKEKNEFYNVDENGKILIFKNFPDFILYNSKYKDNKAAREFLTTLFNSEFISSRIYINDEIGAISIIDYWFDATFDPIDFFNIKYKDLYYVDLVYYIENDKFILTAHNKDVFDSYLKEGYLKEYPIDSISFDNIEITKDDLNNVFFRNKESNWTDKFSEVKYNNFK